LLRRNTMAGLNSLELLYQEAQRERDGMIAS
jgi:hypothetical protein